MVLGDKVRRGLVPALVHDGAVHIESNDIVQYLEAKFPVPRLIPVVTKRELLIY